MSFYRNFSIEVARKERNVPIIENQTHAVTKNTVRITVDKSEN